MAGDRNFDDLAHRFQRNVYESLKGQIRLNVLERDFLQHFPAPFESPNKNTLSILDAGAGRGLFSLPMAQRGHQLLLCDVSVEMLKLAMADAETAGIENTVEFLHGPIQALSQRPEQQFDLAICHAVLEWIEDPQAALNELYRQLVPGGVLSLTFYNRHGLIYKNLLRTNFKKIQSKHYSGFRRSLTPTYPRTPEEVIAWAEHSGFSLFCHSGIRVFYDYIFDEADRARSPDELMAMELHFSQELPYRDLGRYQHLLLKK
ncbi:methyltransferase domain-containing protein [Marinibactrum halimedae]|uniref:tRNA 5-carboxymethoxyuridine methyltransferase n=1 Tax=Marinibactrum halimedae TaxID=1444977 RepID=A0AA37WPP2_9GAMM|nr:methyltransferase domain-containing protein [Marinibactrum halimedae]MCD9461200.1 methyltransferase domain-containing protein [Marinibactrum halimedae]GLS26422.1 tRNA 5-carboxymethoxyuridine methyltransferase [Marinibactrum halimedae]